MIHDAFKRPLRDLRISVTDRCNFRCGYCMPAEVFGEGYRFLPRQDLLTFEEITRLTRILVRLGAVKLRITGGEPLIRRDLESLVQQLSQLEGVEDLAMTTNAYYLPQKAAALKAAGLQRVTVSLDTLDNTIFRQMNGQRADVDQVLAGIRAAKNAGLGPIKVNAVVQRNINDHTLLDLAKYCREEGHILRFIEYMDVGTMNGWQMEQVVSAGEIIAKINAVFPLKAAEANYRGEVAKRYHYRDGQGEIGLITSVTQPFCGNCSRLRLSPEGTLYTCLFATHGTDLRTPLRDGSTDDAIESIIRNIWAQRADRYSEERAATGPAQKPKVEMYHIGG
jgi:cyclic pyranopterin phosphate synthase